MTCMDNFGLDFKPAGYKTGYNAKAHRFHSDAANPKVESPIPNLALHPVWGYLRFSIFLDIRSNMVIIDLGPKISNTTFSEAAVPMTIPGCANRLCDRSEMSFAVGWTRSKSCPRPYLA